jgi:hypothetical protein
MPVSVITRPAINRIPMVRIALTAAACHAVCSKLPEDAPLWPVLRQDASASSLLKRPSSTV